MIALVLSEEQAAQIGREGAAAYPNECCGIFYGRDTEDGRIVEELQPVENAFADAEKFHRFSISPKQLMDAEKLASENGQLVLGFYHSHPDHPARPSEYDRQHAWPFYSYAIVAIAKGQPADLTSWILNDASEQFEAQEIRRR